jgi:Rod binding domain-containing protein
MKNPLGGTMTDTFDIELGQSLSRAGGVGLTDSLLKAERQIVGAGGLIGAGGAGKEDGAGGNGAGRLAEELSGLSACRTPLSLPALSTQSDLPYSAHPPQ